MPETTVHCVIDTQILVRSNAPLSTGVSKAQKERWELLRRAVEKEYVPAYSAQLVQEYITHLTKKRSDLVTAFLKALIEFGKRNHAPLRSHERDDLHRCRYPSHDEHLIHTAKGLNNAMIAAEEESILRAADCVNSTRCRLDVKIHTPSEILAKLD